MMRLRQRSNVIPFIRATTFLLTLSTGMRFRNGTNFVEAFSRIFGQVTKNCCPKFSAFVSTSYSLRCGASTLLTPIVFYQCRLKTQTTKLQQYKRNNQKYGTDAKENEIDESLSYTRPVIQWYPGHIAKAERLLQDTFFKAVDVVIEVRDARILRATSHPSVPIWSIGKPRIVAITHIDMIPNSAHREWKLAFENELKKKKELSNPNNSSKGTDPVCVLFVDAQKGTGIYALKRDIMKAGEHVQEKRLRKGLNQRQLRVGIIGYPNVGKSSLINRLLGGAKRAKAANTPGVTRALQWIKVKSSDGSTSNDMNGEFELLDSPGVIPASLTDQDDASLLAASNCIGVASYDNQAVASHLCQYMLDIHRNSDVLDRKFIQTYFPLWRTKCIERYKFDPLLDKEELVVGIIEDVDGSPIIERDGNFIRILPRTGEDMLHDVAELCCKGSLEDASRKILQDYRTGRMGPICLQAPTQLNSPIYEQPNEREIDSMENVENNESINKENGFLSNVPDTALDVIIKRRGLELPPKQLQREKYLAGDDNKVSDGDSKTARTSTGFVAGRGFFDGW